MRTFRMQFPMWTFALVTGSGFFIACAADPGDAVGKGLSMETGLTDGGGGVPDVKQGRVPDTGGGPTPDATADIGGGGVPDAAADSAPDTTVPESGVDAPSEATTPMDTGTPHDAGTPDTGKDSGPPPPTDAGAGCLQNIPASCPDCQTQNASDMPVCQKYIQCYITNSCNPNDACGSNSGICGVNTVGGGNAPESAAVVTYNCACP